MMTDVALTLPPLQLQQVPWWTQLGDAFDSAQDGVGILDWSLRVVAWNRAAALLTGTPASDTIGYGCDITSNVITIDLSRPPAAPANAEAPGTHPDLQRYDLRIKTPGGRFTVLNVVASLVPVRCEKIYAFLHLSARPIAQKPIASAADGLPVALTEREAEILALLAGGKTAKPIASELSVSLPTVRTHIRHILRKLGVHSCLEAAVWFLRARAGAEGAIAPGFDVAGAGPLPPEATEYWAETVDGAQTPPSNSPTFV
jgi:DNA-binding CsgD family transcriptional regulator